MAAYGELDTIPDAAIFSDTQCEPEAVMEWFETLKELVAAAPHPIPIYRVTRGSLKEASFKVHRIQKTDAQLPVGTEYMRLMTPVFGIDADGKIKGAIGRKCTSDFKIVPLERLLKKLAQIKRGQKEVTVTSWLGISWDELQRMKDSREPWRQNRWPLIEKRMTRKDCLDWMAAKGFPVPPRSACTFCPFHSDSEWKRLRDDDPKGWQDAIEYDRKLRELNRKHNTSLRMELYVHRQCVPLDEVDFTKTIQPEFDFMAECEGMCGV